MARIIDQLNVDLAKPIHNMRMFNAVVRIEFNTAVHAEIFRNAPARVINRRHSSNPMMHRAPKSPVASTSASGYTPAENQSNRPRTPSPGPSCSVKRVYPPSDSQSSSGHQPLRRNQRSKSVVVPRHYIAPEHIQVAIDSVSRQLRKYFFYRKHFFLYENFLCAAVKPVIRFS